MNIKHRDLTKIAKKLASRIHNISTIFDYPSELWLAMAEDFDCKDHTEVYFGHTCSVVNSFGVCWYLRRVLSTYSVCGDNHMLEYKLSFHLMKAAAGGVDYPFGEYHHIGNNERRVLFCLFMSHATSSQNKNAKNPHKKLKVKPS